MTQKQMRSGTLGLKATQFNVNSHFQNCFQLLQFGLLLLYLAVIVLSQIRQ